MNKKGFTLVELLGIIVILSLIMFIAIPNITSLVQKNKRNTYIVDAKKMVSLVEYDLRKGNKEKPNNGEEVKVTLKALSTSDVEKDSDGNVYDVDKSYVKVTRLNGYLVYYVQLVSCNGNSCSGIIETNVDNLDGDNKYDYYKSDQNIS